MKQQAWQFGYKLWRFVLFHQKSYRSKNLSVQENTMSIFESRNVSAELHGEQEGVGQYLLKCPILNSKLEFLIMFPEKFRRFRFFNVKFNSIHSAENLAGRSSSVSEFSSERFLVVSLFFPFAVI